MSFAEALVSSLQVSPYDQKFTSKVESRRSQLGSLFFDTLVAELTADRIQAAYPPKSKDALIELIQKIERDNSKRLNQACLVYYLFLDYDPELTDGDNLAEFFASEIDMPRGYKELIRGFWYLDQLEFAKALVHLSYPETASTFPEKIVGAYVKKAPPTARQSEVIQYICATQPKLVDATVLGYYVETLCQVSLHSALGFVRAASPEAKESLFATIVDYSLQGDRKNVWRLANMPLNAAESRVLYEVLSSVATSGSASLASLARDVMLMRALHTGDTAVAKKVAALGNTAASDTNEVAWSDLARGLSLA
ncbi:hypothetical protein TRVA0_037S01112 [Trichomonascus vanleenenianus]|uniref:ELYS family protein n=1 Tax=Trichomonascus vanleenenianus TaxID=2268995 RepID=UPI003ECAEFB6